MNPQQAEGRKGEGGGEGKGEREEGYSKEKKSRQNY